MSHRSARPARLCVALFSVWLPYLPAQTPSRAAALTAEVDAFATETGGFLLEIPGVADDFVLFGDGQWLVRSDGTARLSAFAHRATALDRELYLVLELDGRVDPGQPGHPPAGAPVTTLAPAAYAPAGPVDPSSWVYYTQASGSLTGLRSFAGVRVDVTAASPVQLGPGASNKNVLPGLAGDLTLTVLQPSQGAAFAPTGPAALRATFVDAVDMCATHVDRDPAASGAPGRDAFALPGVADDYIVLPVGAFREAADGTATLSAALRRQSDYSDRWQLELTLGGRVDPGDPAHPPAGSPVLQLVPSAYAAQGGPVDPGAWRYYTQVAGTLVGSALNDGGLAQLAGSGAAQVGVGAHQGNLFVGLSCDLVATITQQPLARTLTVTGDARLRSNVALRCILPPPLLVTGDGQAVPSVTQQELFYTGSDLGWVQQSAVGPVLSGDDPRDWFPGYVRVVDHQTLALSIPQGRAPAVYPLQFLTPAGISNLFTVDVRAPTTPTLRTEDDRLAGEAQHWVTHQGAIPGLEVSIVVASLSDLPSTVPGIVNLSIGNQLSDFLLLGAAVHDPATGTAVFAVPSLPATLAGGTVYYQSAFVLGGFPLPTSDVWSTVY